MLPNIREHSIVVARVAEIITEELLATGQDLSLEKVIAGALLHDIGKTACLGNDDDHALKGFEICLSHNLEIIADIVAEHVILKSYSAAQEFSEKEIVYYADKRVNHDQVVSLEERLEYILERYGNNDERRHRAIAKNFAACRAVERKIFSALPMEPEQIAEALRQHRASFSSKSDAEGAEIIY